MTHYIATDIQLDLISGYLTVYSLAMYRLYHGTIASSQYSCLFIRQQMIASAQIFGLSLGRNNDAHRGIFPRWNAQVDPQVIHFQKRIDRTPTGMGHKPNMWPIPPEARVSFKGGPLHIRLAGGIPRLPQGSNPRQRIRGLCDVIKTLLFYFWNRGRIAGPEAAAFPRGTSWHHEELAITAMKTC